MNDYILPYLEWEVLHEPVIITKVDKSNELPEGPKKIVIDRDDQYKLQAILYMKGANLKIKQKQGEPGTYIETYNITGLDQYGSQQYTLESCFIYRQDSESKQGEEPTSKVYMYLQGLRIKHKNDNEPAWLAEWFINGPRDQFVFFANRTERKIKEVLTRERVKPKNETIISSEISIEGSSGSWDCLKINTCDNQFLITRVPEEIGPEWSRNISMEYHKKWGKIPNNEDRDKINELCSFIFGRHLLSVGYTIYDEQNNIIEEFACNPWSDNPKLVCSKPDNPPININEFNPPFQRIAESLINQLLPTYYERRESLNINDSLWLYWVAHNMPIGTNLPLYAASVETIMNGWFKSIKTKTRGVYMDKGKFHSILSDEFKIIEERLMKELHGDKIIKRLENAYQMSVVDRSRFFFNEIGLTIKKHEWEAIKARHSVAHGRLSTSEEDWEVINRHTVTYETLLHKVILRVLGYSGTYIDRSTIGWKDKELS